MSGQLMPVGLCFAWRLVADVRKFGEASFSAAYPAKESAWRWGTAVSCLTEGPKATSSRRKQCSGSDAFGSRNAYRLHL